MPIKALIEEIAILIEQVDGIKSQLPHFTATEFDKVNKQDPAQAKLLADIWGVDKPREKIQKTRGLPASDEKIKFLEKKFSVLLPKDYTEFLQTCDGWSKFHGLYSLLSTDEMLSPIYDTAVKDIRMHWAEWDVSADLIKKAVIVYYGEGPNWGYFDYQSNPSTPSFCIHSRREHRFDSFSSFLEKERELLFADLQKLKLKS